VAQVSLLEGTKFGKAVADAFVERVYDHQFDAILRKVNIIITLIHIKSVFKNPFILKNKYCNQIIR